VTAGTEPDTTSVLSHTQRGENRTTVSMRLFRSLVQIAREDAKENTIALECAKYSNYGITPLLFSTQNRTKFPKQVYGEGARVVNAIPQWFLVFSHSGRAKLIRNKKSRSRGRDAVLAEGWVTGRTRAAGRKSCCGQPKALCDEHRQKPAARSARPGPRRRSRCRVCDR